MATLINPSDMRKGMIVACTRYGERWLITRRGKNPKACRLHPALPNGMADESLLPLRTIPTPVIHSGIWLGKMSSDEITYTLESDSKTV